MTITVGNWGAWLGTAIAVSVAIVVTNEVTPMWFMLLPLLSGFAVVRMTE